MTDALQNPKSEIQNPTDFAGMRVLVLGLGVHGGGLGVTRFMVGQGAQVRVTDMKGPEDLQSSLRQLEGLPVEYVLGGHREDDLAWADLIVRNPGVPRESPWLARAEALGKPVEMEISLFCRLCPAPILGVTGTKGKTTTATWAWEMIRRRWPDAPLAGNLRVSALELLPQIHPDTRVVLELSSWQLEGLEPLRWSPPFAAVTNLSPDHLNRYRDMAAYADAKRILVKFQQPGDVAVLNADDPVVSTFAGDTPGGVVPFSLDGPSRHAPSAYLDGEMLTWRAADGSVVPLVRAADLPVPGRHNQANALCAASLALSAGVAFDAVRQALLEFRGVPDRQEQVAVIDGVRYVNDTTATTPAATLAALEAIPGPILLIAGGADKRSDFTELAPVVAARTKGVVLLEGSATDNLAGALVAHGATILGRYDDFRAAILAAQAAAAPGDTVLLSPGCASFGMFRNEFDRGAQFRAIVQALSESPVTGD
jgi:UDP-N-acetylmuramoylalanine--D-glutamate ligase